MEAPVKRSPQSGAATAAPGCGGSVVSSNWSSLLDKFASLLGTKESPNQEIALTSAAASNRMKELAGLLSPTMEDDQVVLIVPSLDLRLTEDDDGNSSVLPEVGEHATCDSSDLMKTSITDYASGTTSPGESRRFMTASVLSMASDGLALGPKAAQNIGKKTSWTRSTVSYATGAVGSNISDSFTTLLNSRLRAWTLLLLRHSLSTGSGESRSRLLSMLAADIQVKSVETTFKTLPLPEAAKGAKPKDSDIILPFLFEVSLHITIQAKPEIVMLRAPGTISAIFDESNGIKKVNVDLDTNVVLKTMVDQARMVVLKAVASATDTPVPVTTLMSLKKPGHSPKPSSPPEETLLRQATKASIFAPSASSNESTRLQKARTSALRLNNVLHGKPLTGSSSIVGLSSDSGVRKVRSIRWDHQILSTPTLPPGQNSPSNIGTAIRMAQTANKLKSFKSFGRPHAGDFGSGPRNATFGEYGRPAYAGAWGRDGRLAAHPMPGQIAAVNNMGNLVGGSSDMNASFDSNMSGGQNNSMQSSSSKLKPSFNLDSRGAGLSAAASAGAALLGRISASTINDGSPPSGSPLLRTATALETSLMENLT